MSMRFDKENQLSVGQAFTGAATVSTNAFEKQSAAQDISIGRRLALLAMSTVAPGAFTTMTIEAIQADDAALTTNVQVIGSAVFTAAQAARGQEMEVPIPQGVMTRRYIGARVTITGGTTTASLDIYLVPQDEIPKYKSFPKVVGSEL